MTRKHRKPEYRKKITLRLVHPPREGVPRAQYAADSREGLLLDAHTFDKWGRPHEVVVTVHPVNNPTLSARRAVPPAAALAQTLRD